MRKQTKIVAVLSAAALLALGASMTSFAAGWTEEDGTWVYLDKDGDRVYDTWKKSGNNYYYLNEDGEMATSTLIEYEDHYYYVDENGVKVTNQWVALENEDDEQIGNYEDISTLWYYFQSSGRAYKDTIKTINGKKYIFDEEGRAISGWYEVGSDLYYLGTEDECWAYTGWQQIEPDDTLMMFAGLDETDAFDAEKWFYFRSNGKAYKDTKKYIGGQYYTFDGYGRMSSKWVTATAGVSTPGYQARYDASFGNLQKGWVYTNINNSSDSDKKWFYLDNYGEAFNEDGRDASGTATAYKWDGTEWATGEDILNNVAAKVIKSKTYLFDANGRMLTGVYNLVDVAREGSSQALDGIYFFNDGDGSIEGEMVTGKETVVYDDVECAYYFDKKGRAYTNTIADGVLYDADGVKVTAEDGNNYQLIVAANDVVLKGSTDVVVNAGETVMVTSAGKIKKSGTVKLDGYKYSIDGYVVDVANAEPID